MSTLDNGKMQFTVHSNVTIRCLDKNKKVIRTSKIHNKATINMVEGILRFLRGDFTPSEYTTDPRAYDTGDAYSYIPTEVRFGHVGVMMKGRGTAFPRLVRIDSGMIKRPTFDEYRLQEEIAANRERFALTKIKFESVEIAGYDDTNNSMALLLHAYIPPGQLVGLNDGYDENGIPKRSHFTDEFVKDEDDPRDGQGWAYWNPDTEEWEAIFTEIGLFSGGGTLLARVAFDGATDVDYTDTSGTFTFKITSKASDGDILKVCHNLNIVAGTDQWPLTPPSKDTVEGNAQSIITAILRSDDPVIKSYDWTYDGDEIIAIEKPDNDGIGEPSMVASSGGTFKIERVVTPITPSATDGRITFENESSDRNPVIQSDTSSLLVEWVIGIVSVGQNDEIVSGAELNNFGMGVGLTANEINDRISGYTTPQTESEILGLINQIGIFIDYYYNNLKESMFVLDSAAVNSLVSARDSLNSLIEEFVGPVYVFNVMSPPINNDKVLVCGSLMLVAGSVNWPSVSGDSVEDTATKIVYAIKTSTNLDVKKYTWSCTGARIVAVRGEFITDDATMEVHNAPGGTLRIDSANSTGIRPVNN